MLFDRFNGNCRIVVNVESQMINFFFDIFDESKVYCLIMYCLIIMRIFMLINIFL